MASVWALPFGRAKGYTAGGCMASLRRGSMSNPPDPIDLEAIRIKLEALKSEHRDLDEVIERLLEKPPFDQLQLQRLKKRKLGLKDQILKLESQLIPDIIA